MELPHVLVVLFWFSLAAVFYAYLGYPFLIWVLARLFGRTSSPPPMDDTDFPHVSVLIAAYNEEPEIEGQVQRLLRLDYPTDKLDLVIASDGSTDGTADLVRPYADRGVRLLDYRERRGKAAVLNAAFPTLKGDIVLLSDANTSIDPQAVRKLARWFQDPRVGVVCGRLKLVDPVSGRNVDGMYWKYETFIKKCEARLGGLLGANGGIYAIRRDVHSPIPENTIVDDFVLPLQAKLRTGCALIYDSEAVAHEQTPARIGVEFGRRSRIGAGGFQSIFLLRELLHPRQGWTAFTFLSHKVARWICPFFLISLFLTSVLLAQESLYRTALLAQVAFYLLSVGMAFLPLRYKVLKPLRLTTLFTAMNAALLVGFYRWVAGTQRVAWVRTARLPETEGVVAG